MDVSVECHSGFRYAERPQAFVWQGERLPVVQIVQAWRSPSGFCFKVITTDQLVFDLAYDETFDDWKIMPL